MYTSTSSVAGDVKLACGFVAIAATAILLPSLQAATPTTTLPVQTVVPVTASQSSAALVRSPFRRDPYFNVAAPAAAEGSSVDQYPSFSDVPTTNMEVAQSQIRPGGLLGLASCVLAAVGGLVYYLSRRATSKGPLDPLDLYADFGERRQLVTQYATMATADDEAVDEAEVVDPNLTVGTGTEVPEFMKGKSLNVVLDLGDIRDRLDGVSVCLVGMNGAPLQQVAKNLSDAFQYAPLDTLELLQSATGEDPVSILKRDGKKEFLETEQSILSQIAAYRRVVVTCAPDIVNEKYNWSHLRHMITIYLKCSPETLAKNMMKKGDDALYMFSQEEEVDGTILQLADRIAAVLEARADKYAQADITVDGDGREDLVAMEVTKAVRKLLEDNAEHKKKLYEPGEVKMDGDKTNINE